MRRRERAHVLHRIARAALGHWAVGADAVEHLPHALAVRARALDERRLRAGHG